MPASETPTNPKTQTPEDDSGIAVASESGEAREPETESGQPPVKGRSGSRYLDYETHELLEKISEYEDERRWQRIREGIWLSIIAHILFFSALTWIPRYVFHQPAVIDPFDAIKQRKDLTYLDQLPDAIREVQKVKPKLPALKPSQTTVDKKTLDALKAAEALRKTTPPPPAAQAAAPPPPQPAPLPPQPAPQLPPSVATPQANPQVALDAPRPAPVPARPNFQMGSQTAADQLNQAMRDTARNHGQGGGVASPSPGQRPGPGSGAEILSDTEGVDFNPYMEKLKRETQRTWYPLMPDEVYPPISKRGAVTIQFKILPNGRVMDGGMQRVSFTGDVALDRAAWGAITGSNYPPLPREFHGPYLEVRVYFTYNQDDQIGR